MDDKQFTVNEHYIPQGYLNRFSSTPGMIFQYDVINDNNFLKPIPIKSICCKNNIYEFKNDEGEFVSRNMIENILSKYEGVFCKTVDNILKRTRFKENYNINCFLSTQEKANLVVFFSLLVLRKPKTIEFIRINNGQFPKVTLFR